MSDKYKYHGEVLIHTGGGKVHIAAGGGEVHINSGGKTKQD